MVGWLQISYAPALREATPRRNVFANAQALARATRGELFDLGLRPIYIA